MQILEAALAFAITMLVLSLVSSSFVELVHRIGSMREAGLKHMLGQVFDQVLVKYVHKDAMANLAAGTPIPPEVASKIETARASFVESMSSNRAPMGVEPSETPTVRPPREAGWFWWLRLWNAKRLSTLKPEEFMERLGSLDLKNFDIAEELKKANKVANKEAENIANEIGQVAAGAVDAVLKDVAQNSRRSAKKRASTSRAARGFSL